MTSRLPQDADLDLTLFVACYNEERNIADTLRTVLSALEAYSFSWEIIVIDDASQDRSVAEVEAFIEQHPGLPIRLVRNEANAGLAQNYIEGAFLGRGRYYRLVCGDNVEDREALVEVFRHLGAADVVLFYQNCVGRSLLRRALSQTFTRLVNLVSGHRIRYYNGMALHRRYDVMRWHTNYHGFGFQADMVTRLLDEGFGYIEVPIATHERIGGKSSALTLRNFLSVVHTFIDLFIRRVGRMAFFRRRVAKARTSPPGDGTTARPSGPAA